MRRPRQQRSRRSRRRSDGATGTADRRAAPPPAPRSIGIKWKGWLITVGVLDRVDCRHEAIRSGAAADRPGRCAILRRIARLRTDVADRRVRSPSTASRPGWTVTVFAIGRAHRADGVPAVATPVHVRRQRAGRSSSSARVLLRRLRGPRPFDVTIDRPLARLLVAVAAGRASSPSSLSAIVYSMVVPGSAAAIAKVVVDRPRRRVRRRPALPRRRPSLRHPRQHRARGRRPAQRVPLLHAERGLPGRVPAGQDRAPRRRRPARRGASVRPSRTSSASPSLDIKPVGLAGSGGSTPLRLHVAGDPDTYLFGKLYAMNHVRADRWYKIGRTILYGRLEDEAPFQSVRRLVAVRGLHAAADARLRHPDRGAVRHRRADAGARVPARHGVLRRRAGDRRRRGRRRRHRRGPRADPRSCGTAGSRTATSSRPT